MNKKEIKQPKKDTGSQKIPFSLSIGSKRRLLGLCLLFITFLCIMGIFGHAGSVGAFLYFTGRGLFGIGYIIFPALLGTIGYKLVRDRTVTLALVHTFFAILFFVSVLGLADATHILSGGLVGNAVRFPLLSFFGGTGSVLSLILLALGSGVVLAENSDRIASTLDHMSRFSDFFKNLQERISFSIPSFSSVFSRKTPSEETTSFDSDYENQEDVFESISTRTKNTENDILSEKSHRVVVNGLSKEEKELAEKAHADLKSRNIASTTPYELDEPFGGHAYTPPPLSLLSIDKSRAQVGDVKQNMAIIKRTLQNFGIEVEMDEVTIGPTVTRYALKPAEGVKINRIMGLQKELSLSLAAHPLRIEAPIPGKSLVGIEIPNKVKSTVSIASLFTDEKFMRPTKPLTVALGRGVSGKGVYASIAKMPHLLIAGTTGSGKSVTIHAIISSLLYRHGPEDVRLIFVDPKRVELTLYNGIPHLLTPVITEPKKAILALKWAAGEMTRRYDVLEEYAVRDIGSYHENIVGKWRGKGVEPEKMPYIVVIIDELADIMQAYPRELEAGIVRLAQMSRAVGIHLILSTQRPEVNVVTGLIKANIPSRIALRVPTQIDSRTILDRPGAEQLLGQGDMLALVGDVQAERVQSAFISEDEVKAVVKAIKDQYRDILPDEILMTGSIGSDRTIFDSGSLDDGDESDDDPLYEEAKSIVIEAGKASTSYIQRKMKVGYARAARLMDMLEDRSVIGPSDGAKPRDVLLGNTHTQKSFSIEAASDEIDI